MMEEWEVLKKSTTQYQRGSSETISQIVLLRPAEINGKTASGTDGTQGSSHNGFARPQKGERGGWGSTLLCITEVRFSTCEISCPPLRPVERYNRLWMHRTTESAIINPEVGVQQAVGPMQVTGNDMSYMNYDWE